MIEPFFTGKIDSQIRYIPGYYFYIFIFTLLVNFTIKKINLVNMLSIYWLAIITINGQWKYKYLREIFKRTGSRRNSSRLRCLNHHVWQLQTLYQFRIQRIIIPYKYSVKSSKILGYFWHIFKKYFKDYFLFIWPNVDLQIVWWWFFCWARPQLLQI